MTVLIVGAGIGGLTLALNLHKAGIPCRIFEAVPKVRPLGLGINLLPHAVWGLSELGLTEQLRSISVETREHRFFTRHGQLIYGEPRGCAAGYKWPQFSIHRGDLQVLLMDVVRQRLGSDAIVLGHRCVGYEQDDHKVSLLFDDASRGERADLDTGTVAVACDGIHSLIRKKIAISEGPPRYSGINMWRGATIAKPFLSGATMVHIGWYATGCLVIYPIRNNVDGKGNQLINWVAQIETPRHDERSWSRRGVLSDFLPFFQGFKYDWLDAPELLTGAEEIFEYPMVDQDPLDNWNDRRVTLLGDAAHPMYPRGSNGAGQAILDAHCLANSLVQFKDPIEALAAYQRIRLKATTDVVLLNRRNPPDGILREVYDRTGDRPFSNLSDVISAGEIESIVSTYKTTAGFDTASLTRREV